MTIHEAIEQIDELKPNIYSEPVKIRWLSELDGLIFKGIISTHEGAPETFEGYTPTTDPDTELIAEAPYDCIYLHYLERQIDYWNGEYGRFNNSNAVYQVDYQEYYRWYNSTHMPLGTPIRYF